MLIQKMLACKLYYFHIIAINFHRFSMAKQFFQNSPLKKLEGMISKLLKLSDQIIQALTVQKYIDHKINQKRRLTSLAPDDEAEEIEANTSVVKKVKGSGNINVLPPGIGKDTRFSITVICHQNLRDRLPMNNRYYVSQWDNENGENMIVIKRDDFLTLPKDLVVKISKEHAKIRGWKNNTKMESIEEEKVNEGEKMLEEPNYQIIDSSVNGTYYLGNKLEGMSKQKPMKLKNGAPFQLRNGDCIGILMDKESKTNEMLVGFEFKTEDKEEIIT